MDCTPFLSFLIIETSAKYVREMFTPYIEKNGIFRLAKVERGTEVERSEG